jgi:cysteine desulfurase
MSVYLDHNATTQIRPEVIAAMAEAMSEVGNPSSVHKHGQLARKAVEVSRSQIGRALCARPEDVVFTSGGTESVNLAINCVIAAGGVTRLMVSAIEHSAVAEFAEKSGLPVDILPVSTDGIAELDWLAERLEDWDLAADGVPFLALMLANNEIGTIQPVAKAAELLHAAGGYLLIDATQAVGKIDVDFAASGADYMAFSGHKFGGPQGAGALIMGCNAPSSPQHHGGGQEKGRRPGTENLAGIVGLGLAIELATEALEEFAALKLWRDEIVAGIRAAAPDVVLLGEGVERLPNTISFAIPGWKRENQVMAMDLAGVSISAGSACSSGKVRGSKVGGALQLSPELAETVVRISLGWNSTRDDVDALLMAWKQAYARVAPRLKVSA